MLYREACRLYVCPFHLDASHERVCDGRLSACTHHRVDPDQTGFSGTAVLCMHANYIGVSRRFQLSLERGLRISCMCVSTVEQFVLIGPRLEER